MQLLPPQSCAGCRDGRPAVLFRRAKRAAGYPSIVTLFLRTRAGAALFDMEYARWLDDDSKRLAELRGGLQAQLLDGNLGLIVEECMQHYDELFQLKAALARADVFHLLTGSWVTPAERCFFWMGGFRPSELLKVRPLLPWRPCRAVEAAVPY